MLCETCRWTTRPGFVRAPRARDADDHGDMIPCPDCGGKHHRALLRRHLRAAGGDHFQQNNRLIYPSRFLHHLPHKNCFAIVPGTGGGIPMGNSLVRNGEVISGAVLAALGVYIFLQSRAYDYYTADGPGPGFFPTWYGVAIVVLSLALIVGSVRKSGAGRAIDWEATGRALGTWAAFAVAVALMGTLGFVVSFALLTFFVVTFVFRRS